jgi:2-phosphoglycerate kinase
MECTKHECGISQILEEKKEMERKYPLFILFGASGSGKSTIIKQLIGRQSLVIALDGDLLWRKEFNTPENGYREFRDLWLKVCRNISQGGKPVLLSQCGEPVNFESSIERRYFSKIHYLALVCDDNELRKRLIERPTKRGCGGEEYIREHQIYNTWLKENAAKTSPNMDLNDTTTLSIEEVSSRVLKWLKNLIKYSGEERKYEDVR